MTPEDQTRIKDFIRELRSRRYTTGVLYLGGGPQWADDLRECIRLFEKLLEESKAKS